MNCFTPIFNLEVIWVVISLSLSLSLLYKVCSTWRTPQLWESDYLNLYCTVVPTTRVCKHHNLYLWDENLGRDNYNFKLDMQVASFLIKTTNIIIKPCLINWMSRKKWNMIFMFFSLSYLHFWAWLIIHSAFVI